MRTRRIRRSAAPPARLLLACLFALAGCMMSRGPFAAPPPHIKIRLLRAPKLSEKEQARRYFFAEYLLDVGATTRRVAVLVEPLKGPLRLVLDMRRYSTGRNGTGALRTMYERYAPLRIHEILDESGRRLGFAFLAEGKSLRLVAFREKRYVIAIEGDLSPGGGG